MEVDQSLQSFLHSNHMNYRHVERLIELITLDHCFFYFDL